MVMPVNLGAWLSRRIIQSSSESVSSSLSCPCGGGGEASWPRTSRWLLTVGASGSSLLVSVRMFTAGMGGAWATVGCCCGSSSGESQLLPLGRPGN